MKFWPSLALLLLLTSCGGIRTVALNITSGLVSDGAVELETEADYETFKRAVPANLKFLEALWYQDQDNEDLLLALTKGYTGYAFAVYETQWLDEVLSGNENEYYRDQAIYYYSKALRYGERYFLENGISHKKLLTTVGDPIKFQAMLESEFSDDDLELVFYFAQAWGGMINLSKTNPLLVAQLPIVKGLYDYACTKQPNFNYGVCELFYGAYEAGRPKMLGGNLAKGKQHFLKAIKLNNDNLLAKVTYLMFYVIPGLEEEEYQRVKSQLEDQLETFFKQRNWNPVDGKMSASRLNFFNAIAAKRFEIIVKNEKEIF